MKHKLTKEISATLKLMEQGAFQSFCLDFLPLIGSSYKGLERHGGTADGKTRKGTPDLIKTLSNGKQIAVQCSTEKNYWKGPKDKDKFIDWKPCKDIDKCLRNLKNIQKIVLCSNQEVPTNAPNAKANVQSYAKNKTTAKITLLCCTDIEKILVDNIENPTYKVLLEIYFSEIYEQVVSLRDKSIPPFVDYKEYFSVFIDKGLFRHDYSLVGREKELKELTNFVKSDKKILVMFGRGGIGKSKILYEFAKRIGGEEPQWENILFIREYVNFDQSTISKIPPGKSIIILEDAHRYDYLRSALSIFGNSDLYNRVKLIISSRPRGKNIINMNLSTSIDINEVCRLDELKDLDIDETREIISNIVGKDKKNLIDYLASMTKDCPLAAVVGSKLARDKQIHPDQIQYSEDFQRVVLDKFLDEVRGIELKDPASDKLLKYLSALAPVRPADKRFREKLSSILKISISDLVKKIDLFENKGLLLRRGRLVRIVPDLLSDHILYNSCVANDGTSTTFADEVYKQFQEVYASNILFNISELEWKAYVSSKEVNLLNDIWSEIKQDFQNAPNYLRIHILDQIKKATVFQPRQVLDIVKIAIDEPSTVEPTGEYPEVLKYWKQKDILEKLPQLLKEISYHLNHIKECCNILWNLGKDDKRELNPYPEHAIRILQDIASYKIGKSVFYNEKLLECIENWMNLPDIHSYRYSPLDILDELLKKEGAYTESKGAKVMFGSFQLNYKNIKPLRERALNILRDCFAPSKPPHVISRVFESLTEVLRYPVGLFGHKIANGEEKKWLPEQLEVLDIIDNGKRVISQPAVNVRVKEKLRWFQLHGRHKELIEKINEIVSSIEENYEFRLCRAIIGNLIQYYDVGKSYEKRQEEWLNEIGEVSSLIKENEKNANKIFKKVISVIDKLNKFKISVNPNYLFAEFTKQYPKIAIEIYELIIKNGISLISRFSSSLLWPLKEKREYKQKLKELLKKGIGTKDFQICINIAYAYAFGRLLKKDFDKEDIINLEHLIDFRDNAILNMVFYAIAELGKIDSEEAKRLVSLVELSDETAENFCEIFDETHGIPLKDLGKEEVKKILSKIECLNVFHGEYYHTDKFLEFVSKKYPDLAVSFLLSRLEYSRFKKVQASNYIPLPYLGFKYAFKGISQMPDYDSHLKRIRKLSIDVKEMDTFWLAELFEAISDSYSKKSLDILDEWLNSKDAPKIEGISFLLREAPDEFLFKEYDFIGKLLISAQDISEKCLRNVRANLFGIAISGSFSRSFGIPSQKSLTLKKLGEETSNKFDSSHPAHKFYLDISNYGKRRIKEEIQDDEELLDE